jgi:hypothetical protein
MTLDEVMKYYGSDKASVFTRTYAKPKDYCRHYDKLFSEARAKTIRMLEIGVGGGESIRGWLDYFPNVSLFGVDIVSGTNNWDTANAMKLIEPRYTFVQGDQGIPSFWEKFIGEHGAGWDFVADDGSHVNTDIIVSFIALWPYVKPGGFYAIEDLGTAYGNSPFFVKANLPNHMDFLKGKIDELNKGGDIDSMTFSKELCVLRKAIA